MNMDGHGLDRIVAELESLRREVHALRQCILGDELHGRGGVVHTVEQLRDDIYGDSARLRMGLIERTSRIQESLDRLERDWNRTRWTVAGWAGGAAAVATFVMNLLRVITS